MSRSYSKIPRYIWKNSEKEDKQMWHSSWRSKEKTRLKKHWNSEDYLTLEENEVSNPWTFRKDGLKGMPEYSRKNKLWLDEDIQKWKRK